MNATHGGDITGFRLRYGREPVDFSASLNPFGPPETVWRALIDAAGQVTPYPDPFSRELTGALAERLGVTPDRVFIGNGAADVIFRLVTALRPRSALLPAPTFAEYECALAAVGSAGMTVGRHVLRQENGFLLDESILGEIVPGLDMLFLCQPNNPTGVLTEASLIRRILARARECGTFILLDECFLEFTDRPDDYSLMREIAAWPGLLILGSFTKLYGMAGVRLGFGVSGDSGMTERLRAAGQPWAVSSLAQAAGLAALASVNFVSDSLAFLRTERRRFHGLLRSLPLTLFPSAANYLFFYCEHDGLHRDLATRGFLIRDCANFAGLGPGYYRVAVRNREDNDALFTAIGGSLNK